MSDAKITVTQEVLIEEKVQKTFLSTFKQLWLICGRSLWKKQDLLPIKKPYIFVLLLLA